VTWQLGSSEYSHFCLRALKKEKKRRGKDRAACLGITWDGGGGKGRGEKKIIFFGGNHAKKREKGKGDDSPFSSFLRRGKKEKGEKKSGKYEILDQWISRFLLKGGGGKKGGGGGSWPATLAERSKREEREKKKKMGNRKNDQSRRIGLHKKLKGKGGE